MKILIRWAINAGAILIVPLVVPGILVDNFFSAGVAALVIGLVNTFLRPLFVLLTFPISIATLGLSTLVINAGLFWYSSTMVDGFAVHGFIAACLGAFAFWIIAWLGNLIAHTKK